MFCSWASGLNKSTQQMSHPTMAILFWKIWLYVLDMYWSTVCLFQAVMGQIQKRDWWSIFSIQLTTTNWSDQQLMDQKWWLCSWWSRWRSSSVWSVDTSTLCIILIFKFRMNYKGPLLCFFQLLLFHVVRNI